MELEQLGRSQRALVQRIARRHLVALPDQQPRPAGELVLLLGQRLALFVDAFREHRHLRAALGVLDVHATADRGQLGRALRVARLEDLDHARETVRDVGSGDSAGVERPHRQLGARLADRLRSDDPDRVADLAHLAGGEEDAVAGAAHAVLAAALQHRPDRHGGLVDRLFETLDEVGENRVRDERVLLGQPRLARLAGCQRLEHVLGEAAPEHALVDAVGQLKLQLDRVLGAAVLLADDHVLGDVDETPRQVARVGRAERGVGEALAGAVGRDEVLEYRQALHEVGLDRALDDLALRVRHQAAHPGELADLLERSARSRVGHHVDRVELVERALHGVADLVGRLRPDVDDRLASLVLCDQAALVLLLDLLDLGLVLVEDLLLVRRDDDVVLRDRDPGLGRVLEPERLDLVEDAADRRSAKLLGEVADEVVHLPLRERAVDEIVRRDVVRVAERLVQGPFDLEVEDDAPRRRQDQLAVAPVLDRLLERDLLGVERKLDFLLVLEPLRPLLEVVDGLLGEVVLGVRHVIAAENHVLGRRRERAPVRRREDVVRREHQDPRLGLRLRRERQVNRHLVAVEVGVERMADERVDLDRLALDQHRLERLDAESVERRRAIQEHRMLGDHLLEHVPDLRDHRVDVLLGRLDVLDRLTLDEPAHDERLEQLERHQLGQPALVELEARAGHDDRAAGVVDALAEQVLPEAPLLPLEHVRERLQRPVTRAGDRTAAAPVVEEGVDGLLQHPLLVVDDDLRRAEVQQPLEAVVPVDDAAVEVVQVARGEPAAVQLHHRAQLGRDNRDRLEHHPLRLVLGLHEGRDDLQPLDRPLLLLTLRGLDRLAERRALGVEVEVPEQLADRLCAHAAREVDAEAVRRAEAVLELAEELLVVDDLLRLELAEELPRVGEAPLRVLAGLTRVHPAGLDVLVHLPDLQRPLHEGVPVLLLDQPVGAQTEVARELADLLGRRSLGSLLQSLAEQAVAQVAGLVEVLGIDALDELRVLALERLAREQPLLDLVDALGDRALLGPGRLVRLLVQTGERVADLGSRVPDLVELSRGQVAVLADRGLADELAEALRVLRRDLRRYLDEQPANEATGLVQRRQALLLGPVGQAAGPELVVLVEVPLLALREVLAPAGEPVLEGGERLLAVDLDPLVLGVDLVLEVVDVSLALLDVDRGDDRGREVQDLLELARSDVEQVADPARNALEEPDVRDRSGEVDVPHTLATHLLPRHLDAAPLADDALVADALVLAAIALPVLRRTEDALAEEPVPLGLQGAVVDRLGLRYLAGRPVANLLARREPDADRVEVIDVDQVRVTPVFSSLIRVISGAVGCLSLSPRSPSPLLLLRSARPGRRPPPWRSRPVSALRPRGRPGPRRPAGRPRPTRRRPRRPPPPPRLSARGPPRAGCRARDRCRAPPQRGAARRPPPAPRPRCPGRRARPRRAPGTASP